MSASKKIDPTSEIRPLEDWERPQAGMKDFEAIVKIRVGAENQSQAIDLINYTLKIFCKEFEYVQNGTERQLPQEIKETT